MSMGIRQVSKARGDRPRGRRIGAPSACWWSGCEEAGPLRPACPSFPDARSLGASPSPAPTWHFCPASPVRPPSGSRCFSPAARAGVGLLGAPRTRGEPAAAARRGRSWRRRRGAERPWHGASPARPGAQPRGPRALSGRGSCAGGSGPGAAARPMERPRAGPPAGGRAAGGRWALRRRLR